MTTPLVIIGCGGFGREVFSIAQASTQGTWAVEGFADDRPSEDDRRSVAALGSSVIGTVADLAARMAPFAAVIAIGSPSVRADVADRLARSPVSYPPLVHRDASLGALIELTDGVILAPGARLSTNIILGRHVHIDQNATVGHDSRLGDFSRLNPQACISGSVVLQERVLIGAGATVLAGLTVGADAVVGAAACVVRTVPAGTVVKGVPAQ